MKKEDFNTKEARIPGAYSIIEGLTERATREETIKGETLEAAADTAALEDVTPENIEAYAPASIGIEADSLSTTDATIIQTLAPRPKQDYAIAGGGFYENIAGIMPALYGEGKEILIKHIEKAAGKIAAGNVLFAVNEKGELYNTLTAYEKAFIIALRVLLSDSTPERHALIEAKRKDKEKIFSGDVQAYEGIDFFGACKIRPEAYARFRYDNARSDKERDIYEKAKKYTISEKEAALLRFGFTDSDIIVVVDKNTFIRDYLGGEKGGKQSEKFTQALQRLSSGKVAFISSTIKEKKVITDSLIRRTASFYGEKKGQKVEYHIISLHPIFTRIFTPNYITYPVNNAEILGAILKHTYNAEGLLTLYEILLSAAAADNFGAIDKRPRVQTFTLKEAELLPLITTEARLKKNRKEAVERLYSDTGINLFYKLGLLAEGVKPPTEAARAKALAAKKDVEIEIHFKRIADSNCKR